MNSYKLFLLLFLPIFIISAITTTIIDNVRNFHVLIYLVSSLIQFVILLILLRKYKK